MPRHPPCPRCGTPMQVHIDGLTVEAGGHTHHLDLSSLICPICKNNLADMWREEERRGRPGGVVAARRRKLDSYP